VTLTAAITRRPAEAIMKTLKTELPSRAIVSKSPIRRRGNTGLRLHALRYKLAHYGSAITEENFVHRGSKSFNVMASKSNSLNL